MDGPSAWSVFSLFLNKDWWKNSARATLLFAPSCFLPAALSTGAFVFILVGACGWEEQMRRPNPGVQEIFTALGIMLVALVLTVACLVPSFTIWLVRLNTFCHAIWAIGGDASTIASVSNEQLKECFAQSHKEILSRAKFLAHFYLLILLASLVPLFICVMLSAICSLPVYMPNIFGTFSMQNPIVAAAMFFSGVCFAFIIALTAVSVIVSSVSSQPATAAARSAIKVSLQQFLPLCLLSALLLAFVTSISEPQTLLSFSADMRSASDASSAEQFLVITPQNIGLKILSRVWQGLTSMVLLTFCLIPYCDLLRPQLTLEMKKEARENP